jgi:hypothetical protein
VREALTSRARDRRVRAGVNLRLRPPDFDAAFAV